MFRDRQNRPTGPHHPVITSAGAMITTKGKERGLALWTLLILLAILIPMSALVIDLGLLRLKRIQLRTLARNIASASVAGAFFGVPPSDFDTASSSDLDNLTLALGRGNDLQSWRYIKRIALWHLKRSEIQGIDLSSIKHYERGPGTVNDLREHEPLFMPNFLATRSFGMYIERGKIGVNQGGNHKKTFLSLELPNPGGIAPYASYNAVKVTAYIENLSTRFAKLLGLSELGRIQASAIATIDHDNHTNCVYPFAVPLCEMYLSTTNSVSDPLERHVAAGLGLSDRCERELTFTEVNWHSNSNRRDGLIRSDLYARPIMQPVIAQLANGTEDDVLVPDPRGVPIRGYFGLYQRVTSDTIDTPPVSSTSAEIASFIYDRLTLDPSNFCQSDIRIGDYFRPLKFDENDYGELGEMLGHRGFSSTLKSWMMEGHQAGDFTAAFGSHTNPKPGYPFLRSVRNDLPDCPPRVGAPHKLTELTVPVPGHFAVRLFPMGNLVAQLPAYPYTDTWSDTPTGAWVNPMCSEPNSFTRNDPNTAPVRKVTVALIAPFHEHNVGEAGSLESPHRYCDFERRLDDAPSGGLFPRHSLPTDSTNPVVVGFTEVNVFDLNFLPIGERPANPIAERGQRNPMSVRSIEYPGCSYFVDDPDVPDDFGCHPTEWQTPVHGALTYFPQTSPSYCSTSFPSITLKPENFTSNSPPDTPTCLDQFPDLYPIGVARPPVADEDNPYGLDGNAMSTETFDWRFVNRRCLPGDMLTFNPSRPCGPEATTYNGNVETNCWEIRDRAPGWGCGGVRARLNCESSSGTIMFSNQSGGPYFPTIAPDTSEFE